MEVCSFKLDLRVHKLYTEYISARKLKKEYARLKASAPSLDTPEQYYENYKNAYDSQLARMETDAINRAYGANLDALQSGGGRAL